MFEKMIILSVCLAALALFGNSGAAVIPTATPATIQDAPAGLPAGASIVQPTPENAFIPDPNAPQPPPADEQEVDPLASASAYQGFYRPGFGGGNGFVRPPFGGGGFNRPFYGGGFHRPPHFGGGFNRPVFGGGHPPHRPFFGGPFYG